MSQVVFSPTAIKDLERLCAFLKEKSPSAAKRAGEAIVNGVQILGKYPKMGRPIEELPNEYREWPIRFGGSGYLALYRVNKEGILILGIKHQKEAGYKKF